MFFGHTVEYEFESGVKKDSIRIITSSEMALNRTWWIITLFGSKVHHPFHLSKSLSF
jgi:hypothetical protein